MNRKEAMHRAEALGREDGNAAAGWYFNNTSPSREDYLRVLTGMRDGDPLLLDTFHSSPLSAEWADGMSPAKLYGDAIEEECLSGLERSIIFTIDVTMHEQDPDKLLSELVDLLSKANCDLNSEGWEED